ncbi:hypothetical protein [Bacillus badius]|uniref:SOS-response repressor and protease LexA n=1 Tax=Bacillus badius TaxID=1455 RepID=A0ABR5AQ13_BACBA|nr:hypothetical protein [Bacillus badius]KIL72502.1 SOS-response repressor and protease LexA [Bacillus badius]MED4718281.1 transcriptional regulator [Bacillus badius]
MRNQKLTSKQQKVLEAVIEHQNKKGYPPAIRELGDILNLASPSTVKNFLDVLKRKGYVTWEKGKPRTLKVLDKGRELIAVE